MNNEKKAMDEEDINREISEMGKSISAIKRNKGNILESVALLDTERASRLVDDTVSTLLDLQHRFYMFRRKLHDCAGSRYDKTIDSIEAEICGNLHEYAHIQSLGLTNSPIG